VLTKLILIKISGSKKPRFFTRSIKFRDIKIKIRKMIFSFFYFFALLFLIYCGFSWFHCWFTCSSTGDFLIYRFFLLFFPRVKSKFNFFFSKFSLSLLLKSARLPSSENYYIRVSNHTWKMHENRTDKNW